MAEGQRRSAPKSTPLTDEAVTRHERLTLILYLEVGLAIIAGMVVLSQFLSEGHVSRPVWITGAVLGGIGAVGFLATYLMRRIGDRKAA